MSKFFKNTNKINLFSWFIYQKYLNSSKNTRTKIYFCCFCNCCVTILFSCVIFYESSTKIIFITEKILELLFF